MKDSICFQLKAAKWKFRSCSQFFLFFKLKKITGVLKLKFYLKSTKSETIFQLAAQSSVSTSIKEGSPVSELSALALIEKKKKKEKKNPTKNQHCSAEKTDKIKGRKTSPHLHHLTSKIARSNDSLSINNTVM